MSYLDTAYNMGKEAALKDFLSKGLEYTKGKLRGAASHLDVLEPRMERSFGKIMKKDKNPVTAYQTAINAERNTVMRNRALAGAAAGAGIGGVTGYEGSGGTLKGTLAGAGIGGLAGGLGGGALKSKKLEAGQKKFTEMLR